MSSGSLGRAGVFMATALPVAALTIALSCSAVQEGRIRQIVVQMQTICAAIDTFEMHEESPAMNLEVLTGFAPSTRRELGTYLPSGYSFRDAWGRVIDYQRLAEGFALTASGESRPQIRCVREAGAVRAGPVCERVTCSVKGSCGFD